MARWISLDAEVLKRRHQPSTKYFKPDAVDQHASRQGVVTGDQPAGQCQSVSRTAWSTAENSGRAGDNGTDRIGKVAPVEQKGLPGCRRLPHHQGFCRRQIVQPVLKLLNPLPRSLDCSLAGLLPQGFLASSLTTRPAIGGSQWLVCWRRGGLELFEVCFCFVQESGQTITIDRPRINRQRH